MYLHIHLILGSTSISLKYTDGESMVKAVGTLSKVVRKGL